MRIILASESILRKKALDILGLKYETMPSFFDEKSIREKNAKVLVKKLAEVKAKTVAKTLAKTGPFSDALIISGDLVVVCENKIYEKPQSKSAAVEMLKTFSNNAVSIIAAVAVLNTRTGLQDSIVQVYKVRFRKLTIHEMKDYVSRYPVEKFAGGFEGDALLRFAEYSSGSYPFITGFPMTGLILLLRKHGVNV
jgi:MAF protein